MLRGCGLCSPRELDAAARQGGPGSQGGFRSALLLVCGHPSLLTPVGWDPALPGAPVDPLHPGSYPVLAAAGPWWSPREPKALL